MVFTHRFEKRINNSIIYTYYNIVTCYITNRSALTQNNKEATLNQLIDPVL